MPKLMSFYDSYPEDTTPPAKWIVRGDQVYGVNLTLTNGELSIPLTERAYGNLDLSYDDWKVRTKIMGNIETVEVEIVLPDQTVSFTMNCQKGSRPEGAPQRTETTPGYLFKGFGLEVEYRRAWKDSDAAAKIFGFIRVKGEASPEVEQAFVSVMGYLAARELPRLLPSG